MLTPTDRSLIAQGLLAAQGQILAIDDTVEAAKALLPSVLVLKVNGAGRTDPTGTPTPCVYGSRIVAPSSHLPSLNNPARGEIDANREVWEVAGSVATLFMGRRGVSFRCEGVLYELDHAEEISEGSTLVKLRLFCIRNQR